MGNKFLGVRDIDEETFRKFRARAIERRLKLGLALTLAMENFLKEEENKVHKKIRSPRLKPFSWGKGTEKTSKEIDEILYGFKK